MSSHSSDEKLLHRALELAREGVGLASPNPCVGAVIADAQGTVVGTGTYTYAGVKHAEILALEAAKERARGGTLYINLEPHAHHGRTAPCTDALIAAGIRRVVASMADPNPKVSGRGFEQLRCAGLQVELGGLEKEARQLNEGFARYIRQGSPFVTLKSAMTLDGKIAPGPEQRTPAVSRAESGFTGQWITGAAAREHAHRLRHENDAILVGIGTILADNPLLTDRSSSDRRRPLLRIVLDSHLRLPPDSRLVHNVSEERKDDVLVFCTSMDESRKKLLEQRGVRVHSSPARGRGRGVDLRAVLRCLGENDITSLLIEGGASVNGTALSEGIVDKVFLYYAPKILGGSGAVPFAAGADPALAGITAKITKLHRLEEDFAVEAYLRDPYA